MAAGTIFTVLANIPWKTVIENAPKVADSATKLWATVSGRKKPDPVQNLQIDLPTDQPAAAADVLARQVQILGESVRNLNEQMQASSELLKSLADQNIKLVQRVELNRRRVARLTRMVWGLIAGLVAVIIYLFMSR